MTATPAKKVAASEAPTMKLGLAYNVFDGEELLESSIRCIRNEVCFVVVVYQTISNFGNAARPGLERLLQVLMDRGFVDRIIKYDPAAEAAGMTLEDKKSLVAADADPADLGGPVSNVGDQFFHELKKRELGRQACQTAGCSHFISMDTDEFYKPEELEKAKDYVLRNSIDVSCCLMRLYFKRPFYEYLPVDNGNAVTFICRLSDDMPLRLIAGRYPVLVDPTRRPVGWKEVHVFDRSVVEMHHYSFVRKNIVSKMTNVSNRSNYEPDATTSFIQQFESWTPDLGILHPHPTIGKRFRYVEIRSDPFNIHLDLVCNFCYALSISRCSRCQSAVYCSPECQELDWREHQYLCTPPATIS